MVDLSQIIEILKLQITTVDEIRKLDVLREVIYRRVEEMLVWNKVVPTINTNRLDIRFEFPSKIEVEGPIAPEAVAAATAVTWSEINLSMENKYEGRFVITDVARARGYYQDQYRAGVDRLALSMAKREDAEIQAAIDAGVGTTIAATAAWNVSGADPAADMIKAIRAILTAEDVTMDDMAAIGFVMPVNCYSEIMKLQEIKNIRTSLMEWMRDTYGVKFYPTKTLTNTMYALIGNDMTARHYVFRIPNIPLVEEKRLEGVGDEYIVRRFFKTWVVPDSAKVTTTKRICKITGVWS